MNFNDPTPPIGVFDSGLGGLSVLRLLPAALPGERFIYIADSGRAPYGEKTPEQISSYSHEVATILLERLGCRALVIACNTATAAAAQSLRQRYATTPIIGMEPAVKPAAEATRSGVVGVMATAGTIGSERYGELLNRYGREITVIEDACAGLVELIEAGVRGEALTAKLSNIVQPMLAAGADTIVLGCTHFPLVQRELAAIVGPNIELIDPAPAVVRETARRIKAEAPRLSVLAAQEPQYVILTSGSLSSFRQNVARFIPHLVARATFALVEDWPAPPPPARLHI